MTKLTNNNEIYQLTNIWIVYTNNKNELTFPFPHYADLLRLACEAVRISAEDLFLLY